MSKHRTRWTEADDEALRSLTREGLTYAQIGERIGRTEPAVNVRASTLGIKHPRMKMWTSHELATAARLYRAGNTVREIGRILQRTPEGVSSMLSLHGVLDSSRQGGAGKKNDTLVYVLRRRGLTYREILLALERTDTVRKRDSLRLWLVAYCARLGVEVPPASSPRKRPDMALVEAVRAELASLTGSTSKYEGSMKIEGRWTRGAA